MKIHYSASEISSASLDIHSKRSDHWRHSPGSDVSENRVRIHSIFFLREYILFRKHAERVLFRRLRVLVPGVMVTCPRLLMMLHVQLVKPPRIDIIQHGLGNSCASVKIVGKGVNNHITFRRDGKSSCRLQLCQQCCKLNGDGNGTVNRLMDAWGWGGGGWQRVELEKKEEYQRLPPLKGFNHGAKCFHFKQSELHVPTMLSVSLIRCKKWSPEKIAPLSASKKWK